MAKIGLHMKNNINDNFLTVFTLIQCKTLEIIYILKILI